MAAIPALAAGTDEPAVDGSTQSGGTGYYISYLVSLPIRAVAEVLLMASGSMGFYSVEELVFPESDSPNAPYVFTDSEWKNVIMPWYKMMLMIASAAAIYQIAILWVGYSTVAGSINPQKMVSAKETAWNLILVVIFMTQVPNIAKYIFEANAVFVDAIKGTLQSRGLYDVAIKGMSGAAYEAAKSATGNPLLDSLIMAAYAGLMLSLNFLYMVRKFVLGVLITVSPLVSWAFLTKKKTPVLLMMSEIVSNGFMSLSHAIVLAFYASMVTYNGDGMFSTWWAKLFAMSLLIPVSSLLRRLITGWLNLIGIDEERYAKMANSSLGGLFATAAVITGTLGSPSGQKPHGSPGVGTGIATSAPSPDIAGGFGTKASGSIEAFSNANGKDAALQSANSWMSSSGQPNEHKEPGGQNQSGEIPFADTAIPKADISESAEGLAGKSPADFAAQDANSADHALGRTPQTEKVGKIDASPKPPLSADTAKSNMHFAAKDTSGLGREMADSSFGASDAHDGASGKSLDLSEKEVETPNIAEPEREVVRSAEKSVQGARWPTLEKAAKTYNKVSPTLSSIGAFYGGVAGAAFGIAPGTSRSSQMDGMKLGRQSVYEIGSLLNWTDKRVNKNKKTGSSLDKPSFANHQHKPPDSPSGGQFVQGT